jgi:hypothetical protein
MWSLKTDVFETPRKVIEVPSDRVIVVFPPLVVALASAV